MNLRDPLFPGGTLGREQDRDWTEGSRKEDPSLLPYSLFGCFYIPSNSFGLMPLSILFSFSLIIFSLSCFCSFVLFCIVFHVVFWFGLVLSCFVLSAPV